MKPCKICGDNTHNKFGINLEPVSICEKCASTIFIQQARWYFENESISKPKVEDKDAKCFDCGSTENVESRRGSRLQCLKCYNSDNEFDNEFN